jgi:hypothetical protein
VIVAARDDVAGEHVAVGEDVLRAALRDQRAERPAAAVAVRQVERRSARAAELDRGRLLRGVARAAAAAALHRHDLSGDFLDHLDALEFLLELSGRQGLLGVDLDCGLAARGIEPRGDADDSWHLHELGGVAILDRHDGGHRRVVGREHDRVAVRNVDGRFGAAEGILRTTPDHEAHGECGAEDDDGT